MGAVVEQMQQTYDLQVNGYYSQLHLVEDYLLQEKELSLETDNKNFLRRGKKNLKVHSCFFRKMVKAITVQMEQNCGLTCRVSLLLDLRNGHNIAKLGCLES